MASVEGGRIRRNVSKPQNESGVERTTGRGGGGQYSSTSNPRTLTHRLTIEAEPAQHGTLGAAAENLQQANTTRQNEPVRSSTASSDDARQLYTLLFWIAVAAFLSAIAAGSTARIVIYHDRSDFFVSNAPIFVIALTYVLAAALHPGSAKATAPLGNLVLTLGSLIAGWFTLRSFSNAIRRNETVAIGICVGVLKSAMMMVAAFWVVIVLISDLGKKHLEWFVRVHSALTGWLFVTLINGSKYEQRRSAPNIYARSRQAKNKTPPATDSSPASTCYDVLGVSPTASVDAIKAAYRERLKQYHPDRMQDLGPKLRDLAEQETMKLNIAYAEALRRSGQSAAA